MWFWIKISVDMIPKLKLHKNQWIKNNSKEGEPIKNNIIKLTVRIFVQSLLRNYYEFNKFLTFLSKCDIW